MKMEKVKDFIKKELEQYFVVNDRIYLGSTDYKDKKNNGITASKDIHEEISEKVKRKFGLKAGEIEDNRLEIDLWDGEKRVAYELVLGNGEEFWKDVLKALKFEAKKLVIFCRNYPDKYVNGYKAIESFYKSIESFLKGKLEVEIECVNP